MKMKRTKIGFAMNALARHPGAMIIAVGALAVLFAAPVAALADHTAIKSMVFNPNIIAGPLTVCVGATSTNVGKTQLPVCTNLCDFVAQVAQVIYYVIGFVIWIIVPLFAAIGGIMIMLGGASPEMVSRGRGTILGAVWGLVIVLCAWLIVATFVHVIGITGVGGFGTATCSL